MRIQSVLCRNGSKISCIAEKTQQKTRSMPLKLSFEIIGAARARVVGQIQYEV